MKTKIFTVRDLRAKKPAEITQYIKDLQVERSQLIHELQTNKSKKTHELAVLKRAIAQARTIHGEYLNMEKES